MMVVHSVSPLVIRERKFFRIDAHDMVTIVVQSLVDRLMLALQVAADHAGSIKDILLPAVKQVPVPVEDRLMVSQSMLGQAIGTSPDIEFPVCRHDH